MQITQAAILPDEEPRTKQPQQYRILVVDDDEACARLLTWCMEDMGQTPQIAYDGETALEMAKSFQPDLILLDIGLPGMNGYQTCQAMRKEPVLQKTLIIAQTGWGEKEHLKRSKEAGFDEHLIKPIDRAALKNIFSTLEEKGNLGPQV